MLGKHYPILFPPILGILLLSFAQTCFGGPVVLNNEDSGPGSLRQAIADASPGDTITFSRSIDSYSIVLTSGELIIDKPLTIDASPILISISGNGDGNFYPSPGDSRIFNITAAANPVTLDSLFLADGLAPDFEHGGAILNSGNLLLRNTLLYGNDAGIAQNSSGNGGNGGGIYNTGTLTVQNCAISENNSGKPFYGETGTGGNDGTDGGHGGNGGGIYNTGMLTIQNSFLEDNDARDGADGGNGSASGDNGSEPVSGGLGGNGGSGGAIYNDGTLIVQNSTITGNSAGKGGIGGGGNYYAGTLIGNSADGGDGGSGGGIFTAPGKTTELSNTIIAQNGAGAGEIAHPGIVTGNRGVDGVGPDLGNQSGIVTRTGRNLVGDNHSVDGIFPSPTTPGEPNSEGDLVGTTATPFDPMLEPPAIDGFRTVSRLPMPDSPVKDFGDNSVLPPDSMDLDRDNNTGERLPVDQRGVARVVGSAVDLGAVERLDEQPDIRIGKKRNPATHNVDDSYSASGRSQRLRVILPGRRKMKFHTSVQNDGEIDSLFLRSNSPNRNLKVTTFRLTGGKQNVSAAMTRSQGVELEDLFHDGIVLFQTQVKARGRKTRQALKYTVSSLRSPAKKDVAKPMLIAK